MNQPLSSGVLTITLNRSPVSQQARAEIKAAFQTDLQALICAHGFLLTGDVSVSIEWTVQERTRYETDRAPDVDNILKPLLDALVGPKGILIDDNQVQHVSCHWLDVGREPESLAITIRYLPGEWLPKSGLYFVQFQDGLCIPLCRDVNFQTQHTIVSMYQSALALRNDALTKGIDYRIVQACMPIQRVFHRTRIGAFDVISATAFAAQNAA
jgi:Holliday junction resolvase RusA-like endonuclease